ncbi:sensor histidine kinase [Sandaracinus amylolyticus]|uniref:sensor histidine kinase n=1 Tax=Sandaracinus amylolyticus TaxID=927083 RepID=UPI001F2887DF|nr:ATP-binding protein [Sandaracinus amylolyticus]UJR78755.1 Two-component sensor histidine kinase [Sandaracinus amylolyticus]
MSLSGRLTIALTLAALVLFGAVGAWQLRAEEDDLRRAARHDMSLLGRSLQVAFENALRDLQEEDVQETLRELERIDPEVDVFVYDAAGAQIAASTGAVERARWLGARPTEAVLRFLPEHEPGAVELLVPLHITRSARPATLVVWRPLDDMQHDLVATRRRVWLSVVGFAALVALLTMGLSRVWVGAPLARMIAQMKRVRRGDLSPFEAPQRADEVGQALRELEQLVTDLRDARARLDAESDARARLEHGLREVDKLATVGQLAAGLAHEIGSPLQILEGRVAALETKADDPNETRRLARIVLTQAQRITRIVSRLGDLARRRPQRVRVIDVTPPVRAVVDLLEADARKRGVALTLESEAATDSIEGDPDAIQQLTLNLVRNALQAAGPGDAIVVRIAESPLERADGSTRTGVAIEVRDDGCGMDETTRSRALEAFFTTRASEGGSGLGLAVVKGIVEELGGRIVIESEAGAGTTVRVILPAGSAGEGGSSHAA